MKLSATQLAHLGEKDKKRLEKLSKATLEGLQQGMKEHEAGLAKTPKINKILGRYLQETGQA